MIAFSNSRNVDQVCQVAPIMDDACAFDFIKSIKNIFVFTLYDCFISHCIPTTLR